MNKTIQADWRHFLATSGYCSPPGRAACALQSARTLAQWRELENGGLVRLKAEPEQENYFDVYGEPETAKERKAIEQQLDRDGCWIVIAEYFDGTHWQQADSIGMCSGYSNPTDPFQNDYVTDLMRSAIKAIPQPGEH